MDGWMDRVKRDAAAGIEYQASVPLCLNQAAIASSEMAREETARQLA